MSAGSCAHSSSGTQVLPPEDLPGAEAAGPPDPRPGQPTTSSLQHFAGYPAWKTLLSAAAAARAGRFVSLGDGGASMRFRFSERGSAPPPPPPLPPLPPSLVPSLVPSLAASLSSPDLCGPKFAQPRSNYTKTVCVTAVCIGRRATYQRTPCCRGENRAGASRAHPGG